MAMFIRVKRKKATYFIHCDPSETVIEIKAKLQVLSGNPVDRQCLIAFSTQHTLDDAKTLADEKVGNDDVMNLTLRTDDGEWETVEVDNPSDNQIHVDYEST